MENKVKKMEKAMKYAGIAAGAGALGLAGEAAYRRYYGQNSLVGRGYRSARDAGRRGYNRLFGTSKSTLPKDQQMMAKMTTSQLRDLGLSQSRRRRRRRSRSSSSRRSRRSRRRTRRRRRR